MNYTVHVMRTESHATFTFADGFAASKFFEGSARDEVDTLVGIFLYGPTGVEAWFVDGRGGHELEGIREELKL